MKSLILAAALTGVFLPGTALATSLKDSASPVTAPAPRPIPITVVKPTGLPLTFDGALVNIEFSLDQNGQPREIKVPSVKDPIVKRSLVEAFSQWRFDRGVSDGANHDRRFVLPLELRAET